MSKRSPVISLIVIAMVYLAAVSGCGRTHTGEGRHDGSPGSQSGINTKGEIEMAEKIEKTDEEWQELLTPQQYEVTRQGGTEPAFTGKYHDFKGKGIYACVCCGNDLFTSDTKYNSGTGWPSFWAPVFEGNIKRVRDTSYGMIRTEIRCNRCDAHLGHVFEDGPPPTGLRYCINSAALKFVEQKPESGD